VNALPAIEQLQKANQAARTEVVRFLATEAGLAFIGYFFTLYDRPGLGENEREDAYRKAQQDHVRTLYHLREEGLR
jgi:predicted GTPase